MERPDANGFVNIKWPSKNVPYGGIFHTQVVKPSVDRAEFLKVLLEESRLTIAQREKNKYRLRQSKDNDEEDDKISQLEEPLVRPRTSRRRTFSEIRESGILEVEKYRPVNRAEDREEMKLKLQEKMEWGDEKPKPQQPSSKPQEPVPLSKTLPTSKEMKNDLLTQIRERVDWLADMEALGEAAPHRSLVQDQILERIRQLDTLGIDSKCSSARTGSGFSTTRSTEQGIIVPDKGVGRSSANSCKSVSSKASSVGSKRNSIRVSPKDKNKQEENVSSYGVTYLKYSPRRRL